MPTSPPPAGPNNGDLVPHQPKPTPPAAHDLNAGGLMFWSNLDVHSEEGANLFLKCGGDPDLKAADAVNQVFPTKWLWAEPVEKADEKTGEIVHYVRTVLIAPDGRTLSFGSFGVLRSLKLLVYAKGPGPWDPPLNLRLRQKELPGAKRLYLLELVPASPPPPPTEKDNVDGGDQPAGRDTRRAAVPGKGR